MIPEIIIGVIVCSGAVVFLEKKGINNHKKNLHYKSKDDATKNEAEAGDESDEGHQ